MQSDVAAAEQMADGMPKGRTTLGRILPHLLVVAGAVLCALCVFSQAGLIAEATNSDISLPQAFAWDMLHGGHPWTGFELPRIPSLFPDMPVAVLLRWLVGSWRWAMVLYGAAQFIALIYAAGWLVAILARQGIARSAGMVLLLFSLPLLLSWDSYSRYYQAFLPVEHWGPFIASLLVAALAVRHAQRGSAGTLVLIGLLASLVFLADRLLIVEMVAPLCLALAACWRAGTLPARRALPVIEATAAGLLAGWFLLHGLIALGMPVAPPPAVGLPTILASVRSMLHAAPGMVWADPAYAVLTSLLPLLAMAAWISLPALRRPASGGDRLAPDLLRWFAVGAVAADLVFFACFYVDAGSYRYLIAFRVWPLIVLAALLLRLPWPRRWAHVPVAVVTIGWLCGFGLANPAGPAILRARNPLAECLLHWRTAYHLQAGLAGYWQARSTELATNETMQLAQIAAAGGAYLWQNNVYWYLHAMQDPARLPAFNFIVTKDLNPERLRAVYGTPDRVLYCDTTAVWLYRDPSAVRDALFAASPALRALLHRGAGQR